MKAQIHLFLKEDNSFQCIFDGTPVEFGTMLHKMGCHSPQTKSAIFIAAAALLKDEGDEKMVKQLWEKIAKLNS